MDAYMDDYMIKRALRALTDRQLNDLIANGIVEARAGTPEDYIQHCAADEWRTRHPNTISPASFERALVGGGFPACYSGPRITIDLDSGQVVYAAPQPTAAN